MIVGTGKRTRRPCVGGPRVFARMQLPYGPNTILELWQKIVGTGLFTMASEMCATQQQQHAAPRRSTPLRIRRSSGRSTGFKTNKE